MYRSEISCTVEANRLITTVYDELPSLLSDNDNISHLRTCKIKHMLDRLTRHVIRPLVQNSLHGSTSHRLFCPFIAAAAPQANRS